MFTLRNPLRLPTQVPNLQPVEKFGSPLESKFNKPNIPNINTKLKLPNPSYQTKTIKTDKFKLALPWHNSTQSCSRVKLFQINYINPNMQAQNMS